MGHFIDKASPLHTSNLEIKWGEHTRGDRKETPALNTTAKTLGILIRGKFQFTFEGENITLEKEGDYIFFDSGVSHTWEALEDSLTVTIRWPSLPDDQKPV